MADIYQRCHKFAEGDAAPRDRLEKKIKTAEDESADENQYENTRELKKQITNLKIQLTKSKKRNEALKDDILMLNEEMAEPTKTGKGSKKKSSPTTQIIGISAVDHGVLQSETKKTFEKVRFWAKNWSISRDEVQDLSSGQKKKLIKLLSSNPKIASEKGAAAVLDHERGAAIIVEALLCHIMCKEVIMRPFRFLNGFFEILPNVEEFLEELLQFTAKGKISDPMFKSSLTIKAV